MTKVQCEAAHCGIFVRTFSCVECCCGKWFCSKHKAFENHSCTVNQLQRQQEFIRTKNPAIVKPKIDKI